MGLKSLIKFIYHGFVGDKETQSFYNRTADFYESAMDQAKIVRKLFASHEKSIPEIMNKMPRGEMGLDIGCGTGLSTLELIAKTPTTTGLDFSKKMLKQAKEKDISYLINADMTQMPFPDKYFDRACAIGVLRHLPEEKEEQFFKEIYRVLSNNGIFMSPALKPSLFNKLYSKVYDKFMKYLGYNERLSRQTVDNLKNLGEQAGFYCVFPSKLKNSKKAYVMFFVK